MFENTDIKLQDGFDMAWPRLHRVKQKFDPQRVENIPAKVAAEFAKPAVSAKIRPGMRVALTAGSRGIANLREIITAVVHEVKQRGGSPFVVPAMGSHGGATAEGQRQVIAGFGITEGNVGCPVVSSMDTVELGQLENGLRIWFDKNAYESDAVIAIGRVKPHTDFKGPVESGIQKMMVIGLGKHIGASSIHRHEIPSFGQLMPIAAKLVMEKAPIAIGIGLVENAYDQTCEIVALPVEDIAAEEPAILARAKTRLPKLLLKSIDVLVVERFGKEVSGAGMDPNVTGRNSTNVKEGFVAPPIQKIWVRDLTDESHGNAACINNADIITSNFFNKIDFSAFYTNVITSSNLNAGKLPLILPNDRIALAVAIKTCNRIEFDRAKVVWIKDTLHLEYIYVSASCLDELKKRDDVEITGETVELSFNDRDEVNTRFDFG
ncbi:lactate racemase domain-containing protein [Sodalis sp. RH16]|uniref:lactate racemase domain-containing protein n=1 Tax=Sodalis sp. RH16 TaxID=3394331 RepID=UPI0039B3F03C